MIRSILHNSLIILIAVSCDNERKSEIKQLTLDKAVKICENGLRQTLDKDIVEYGAIDLEIIGTPKLIDRSWNIEFKLVPNTPKNFMKCVAKHGGGVSISLVSALD